MFVWYLLEVYQFTMLVSRMAAVFLSRIGTPWAGHWTGSWILKCWTCQWLALRMASDLHHGYHGIWKSCPKATRSEGKIGVSNFRRSCELPLLFFLVKSRRSTSRSLSVCWLTCWRPPGWLLHCRFLQTSNNPPISIYKLDTHTQASMYIYIYT